MYGPLRLPWCMRFEAKHQYFKIGAHNCRNFVNIATTLSNRHQFRQCWEYAGWIWKSQGKKCDHSIFIFICGAAESPDGQSQPLWCRFNRESYPTCVWSNSQQCEVCCQRCIAFWAYSIVWQIKYIFNIDTMWLLCGKMLIPLSYDRQFHACSVKVDKEWTLLKPGDEMDFQTNDTYSVDDCLYVTVRHCV